jgi:FMN reductase
VRFHHESTHNSSGARLRASDDEQRRIATMITIISSSLRSDSNSRILAREAQRVLAEDGRAVTLIDLREHPLPLCDGEACYAHPEVARLQKTLGAPRAFIIATPIYNYDGTAAVKNLIELTGSAWENKVVGFLCAAAGKSSYMSIMALANSLMLDFRSVVVPRFVYATGGDFVDGALRNPEQRKRPTRHLIDEQSYDCSESAEARSDGRFDIYARSPEQRDDISHLCYAGCQSAGVSGARSFWLVIVGRRRSTSRR